MTSELDTTAVRAAAAVFLPAALPREGRIAFWSPDGRPLPGADDGDLVARTVRETRSLSAASPFPPSSCPSRRPRRC
jgi:hypothetical protein